MEDVELLQVLQEISETKPVKFQAERFNRSTMRTWDSRERLESPPFRRVSLTAGDSARSRKTVPAPEESDVKFLFR
jgi:hypothetical protein